ncbi:hypothetical protein C121_65 [Stenotrophomonas phage C121]|uniref:hypothetical protein n=1 Tax=Stenotrophomonas phage C121 TaxID=2914029 RepID=UPI002329247C|nr:hypothetical protein PP752_gp65 [Stenotrophomonas phage C121]UKL14798.1 hypothetical protein C121_65 [Stenotrophomonas phage C121]
MSDTAKNRYIFCGAVTAQITDSATGNEGGVTIDMTSLVATNQEHISKATVNTGLAALADTFRMSVPEQDRDSVKILNVSLKNIVNLGRTTDAQWEEKPIDLELSRRDEE